MLLDQLVDAVYQGTRNSVADGRLIVYQVPEGRDLLGHRGRSGLVVQRCDRQPGGAVRWLAGTDGSVRPTPGLEAGPPRQDNLTDPEEVVPLERRERRVVEGLLGHQPPPSPGTNGQPLRRWGLGSRRFR